MKSIQETEQQTYDAIQSLSAEVIANGGQPWNGVTFLVAPGLAISFKPPFATSVEHVEFHIASRAVRLASEAAGQRRLIGSNERLSPAAKVADIAAGNAKALIAFEQPQKMLDKATQECQQAEVALYTPPRPVDVIEAMEDREIRDWLGSHPDAQAETFREGVPHRCLLAIMRSPTPLNPAIAKMATHAWRTSVEARDAIAANAVAMRLERVEFARLALLHATQTIPSARPESALAAAAAVAAGAAAPPGPQPVAA